MGNCAGKGKKTGGASAAERKRVYLAQDSLVKEMLDDEADGADEGDRDSVGPASSKTRRNRTKCQNDWDPDTVYPLLPGDDVEKRKGLKKLRTVVSQQYDELDHRAVQVDLTKYVYPFENLVFEGGGNKGLAYCGAVRVLEELGVWPQVKRFAGSSAGAMTAALLAVGYDSYAIEGFLSQDLSKIFLDHSCWYFSLLPNLVRGYGWNPGKRILNWFGQALEEQTGNADITFNEIYENYGKELCVVVTNLNMMNAEYFHPKTTPDTPVRLAVRMSMAIPGLFQATKWETHGQVNTYVDGGVLCNYPISCYDGWWLSMKMQDSFLNRLQPLENFTKLFEKKERFGTYNEKTLGFLLYADNERDILRDILQQRVGSELPPFPDTKLALEKKRKKKLQEKVKLKHIQNLHAVSAFLKVLRKHNEDEDDKINKTELAKALADEEDFPPRYAQRLFGKNVSLEKAMAALDEDGNGEIYYHELVHFIERTGVSLQARFLGYQRKEIKGVFQFFDTLQSALLTNVKRIFVEENDIERTVGINTGHVGTSDFKLEPKDREFVVEQGRRSTEAFLRYYVIKNDPQLKPEFEMKSVSEVPEAERTDGKTVVEVTPNGKSLPVQNGASDIPEVSGVVDESTAKHEEETVLLVHKSDEKECVTIEMKEVAQGSENTDTATDTVVSQTDTCDQKETAADDSIFEHDVGDEKETLLKDQSG